VLQTFCVFEGFTSAAKAAGFIAVFYRRPPPQRVQKRHGLGAPEGLLHPVDEYSKAKKKAIKAVLFYGAANILEKPQNFLVVSQF
jgi:hypothetical protein